MDVYIHPPLISVPPVDIPTIFPNTQKSLFLSQLTIASAHAHWRRLQAVTSASHSGNVVMQPYQFSLLFTIFWYFLNKIIDVTDRAMESKANVKLGSLINESLIDDVS
jgi:hypothetical protein